MKWTEETSRIGRNHPCHWAFYHREYDVCMKNTLPRAHVGLLTTTNSDYAFQGKIDTHLNSHAIMNSSNRHPINRSVMVIPAQDSGSQSMRTIHLLKKI